MKAWEARRGFLGLHDVEPPDQHVDETLVQVRNVGLCGSDLPKLLRPTGFALPEFWRPGHEIVGSDPSGRMVAVDPLVPCTTCSRCAEGNTHLCPHLRRLGWDIPGGYAEVVSVPSANVQALPVTADPLVAVLADPAAVAIHGLRCHPIGEPGRMAVVGPGTVGLLTALYAHDEGWKVTVVHRDGSAPGPAIVRALPVRFRSSSSLSTSEAFDLVVDAATGANAGALESALRLVREGGTIVIQNAYHPHVRLATPLCDVFRRSIRLIGSFSYCRRCEVCDFRVALQMLRDHHGQVQHLVLPAGSLADLRTILDRGSQRGVRRVLVVRTRA